MAGPEPGWYPDPEKDGAARYWDGTAWTDESIALEHVPTSSPPPPTSPPLARAAPVAPPPPSSESRPLSPAPSSAAESTPRRAWLIAGYGLLVAAAAVAGFAFGHRSDDVSTAAPAVATGISSTTSTGATPAHDANQAGATIAVASVSASSTRATTSDACSPPHATPFDAANLTDGRPDSAWMPAEGDARPSVTLTFAQPVRVSGLQIVNGYPKRDPCRTDLDRYYQFMRPTRLSVDLHDGRAAREVSVADTSDRQTLAVTGTTDRMTLTILQSAPPDASRIVSGTQIPFSIPAIGEVTVSGSPAGGNAG